VIKKQQIVILVGIIFFVLINNYICAQVETIKLALFDTPYNEMPLNVPLLSEYEKNYLAGVEAAAQVAKAANINIVYKPFFYGAGPLDVLSEISKVQEWQPDLIIGPGASDQFLLLKNYIFNTMVLSSYASDISLTTLPKNFYSVNLPDVQVSSLLSQYIHQQYPQKNIYVITQIDSKECVDASDLFINSYHKISPATKITQNKLILDNVSSIDSKKLMTGHEQDIVVIFNFTYYGYSVLIRHIAASFPKSNLIFFSNQDDWNDKGTDRPRKNDNLLYQSYRIGPVIFDSNDLDYKEFENAYYKLYHQEPVDSVSFMLYLTVMSVVKALIQFPPPETYQGMREKILYSYTQALKYDPTWFRLKYYAIYQLTPQGEVLITKFAV